MSEPQPIVDRRAWGALAVCSVVAGALVWWKPVLAWFVGAFVAYLVLRAFSYVAAAKGAMADPEERLAKERAKTAQSP
jgi:hypothetical protein